jgi:hypothetical protein
MGQASWTGRQTSEGEEGGEVVKSLAEFLGTVLICAVYLVVAVALPLYAIVRFVKWVWLN